MKSEIEEEEAADYADYADYEKEKCGMDDIGDPRTYAVIGAAMEVHRVLGPGFLESVYDEALAIEFELRGIPFQQQITLPVHYKDRRLKSRFKTDFLCYDSIVVEDKAISALTAADDAQAINYLAATRFEVGLILNFGARSLQYKRIVLSQSAKSA